MPALQSIACMRHSRKALTGARAGWRLKQLWIVRMCNHSAVEPLVILRQHRVVSRLSRGMICHVQATLECEPPNANLHKFQGRLKYTADREGARLNRLFMWPCCPLRAASSCAADHAQRPSKACTRDEHCYLLSQRKCQLVTCALAVLFKNHARMSLLQFMRGATVSSTALRSCSSSSAPCTWQAFGRIPLRLALGDTCALACLQSARCR